MPTHRQTVTFEYDVADNEYPRMGTRDYFAVSPSSDCVGSDAGSISPWGRELRIVDVQPSELVARRFRYDVTVEIDEIPSRFGPTGNGENPRTSCELTLANYLQSSQVWHKAHERNIDVSVTRREIT